MKVPQSINAFVYSCVLHIHEHVYHSYFEYNLSGQLYYATEVVSVSSVYSDRYGSPKRKTETERDGLRQGEREDEKERGNRKRQTD